jgi:hypothetical protein
MHQKCVRIASFLKVFFFVSCLAQTPVLPGGQNSGQKGQKAGRKKSALEEFKAEFYQKRGKGAKKILKRCFLF